MKKIYVILLITTILTSACEKLVEVDAPTNQIGTDQVFEDLQTANSALEYLYAKLRTQSVISGGSNYGASVLLESYADNLDYYGSNQYLLEVNQDQIQETNTFISSIWNTAYLQVYYANSIIHGVENSTGLSAVDKKRIKGEALLIRSLIYFYLQQLFGDIPYTTSTDYEYNSTLCKTDGETILTLLEGDLKEASFLMQDDYRNDARIYPNRKAAQLMLARIYALREEWSLTEKMADTILLSPLYQFQTDINEVFHKSGTHIIWQMEPSTSGNDEASFYYFANAAPQSYALTQNLVNIFSDDDLRKQAWIKQVTYNSSVYYRANKYKDRTTSPTEYPIVFRLEEVYLIMAESMAMQNRFDEALPYLNATRERAGLTAITSLSGDDFINELMAEKRREFFCESGHRFIDLKRWGKLDELSALKTGWEDYKQVWPLPQSEMLLNLNLSPQNSGY
jgi:starch-binding outer membrane protein, SusD/RagB family